MSANDDNKGGSQSQAMKCETSSGFTQQLGIKGGKDVCTGCLLCHPSSEYTHFLSQLIHILRFVTKCCRCSTILNV